MGRWGGKVKHAKYARFGREHEEDGETLAVIGL
jgi:hypothetical protein